MKLLKETTIWETKIPNHTYAFESGKCVGFIREGSADLVMFKAPLKHFDKRYRKFEEVKCEFNTTLD